MMIQQGLVVQNFRRRQLTISLRFQTLLQSIFQLKILMFKRYISFAVQKHLSFFFNKKYQCIWL